MKIAVEGCAHGELEIIYDTIKALEEKQNLKVDLLICCGDFQACRNEKDLHCMAVPPKYYNMCSFYKYYNGEKKAPILTIFVGGNHEASNYLQELPYGGWVAPNIYYLGYAGVINIAGVRIGGISGIYKGHDFLKGHYETSPYDNNTKRSVYHIRNLEVFRLKQVSQPVDIFISHDWPTGIWNHGDCRQLLRFKPFFKNDMESGKLGSKPCEELLNHLQPQYYFAAHLHCKFAALVQHSDKKVTRFLALDKCLPKRRFLQITEVPHDPDLKIEISYDLEWLAILNLTNHLLSVKGMCTFMPGNGSNERPNCTKTTMKIAVEGCAHGELEIIYDTIKALEEKQSLKVDLLICCGDFQACRNEKDLHCMAVPPKYYNMCSFYKYYNGEKKAPILTIFVGGNHEASNYLQELPYGGWVAPNIYYLGYAGVINIAGVRIGGISGIYKGHDFLKGHYETSPYDNNTKRSVYHIRNLEVFRLKQVSQPVDIFISHDWPTGIWNHGDCRQLLRFKPFFKNDMESGKLGSKPCEELLNHLQPQYYFAAHLHCKFAALVRHSDKNVTRFLALDKCLPKRRFLQITEVPHDPDLKIEISYDLEWLAILNLTNHLLSVKGMCTFMPGNGSNERWQFTPTEDEKAEVSSRFSTGLMVPHNFTKTVPGYNPQSPKNKHIKQPPPQSNPQTAAFCKMVEVDDPLALLEAYSCSTIFEDSVDVSGSANDSMVSEEGSDAYETFMKTKSPRLSLNLPKPKFEQSGFDETLSEESSSVLCESASGDNSEVVDTVAPDSSESRPKKFKRRNASLYCSEEA